MSGEKCHDLSNLHDNPNRPGAQFDRAWFAAPVAQFATATKRLGLWDSICHQIGEGPICWGPICLERTLKAPKKLKYQYTSKAVQKMKYQCTLKTPKRTVAVCPTPRRRSLSCATTQILFFTCLIACMWYLRHVSAPFFERKSQLLDQPFIGVFNENFSNFVLRGRT